MDGAVGTIDNIPVLVAVIFKLKVSPLERFRASVDRKDHCGGLCGYDLGFGDEQALLDAGGAVSKGLNEPPITVG